MNKGTTRAFVLLSATLSVSSCAGSSSVQPVPSLAESLGAQASFQTIREQWLLSTPQERAALEPKLEAFRVRHGSDPLARIAEAYLAFIALDRNDRHRARALAFRVRQGPLGNTQDLGTLIDGAVLARSDEPEAALQLLDPLVGKMIDAFAQDLLHEAAVAAAVDAHRWYQAIVYMNEWIRSSNDQDLPSLRPKLDSLLATFPPTSLESALRAMGAARQGDIWEKELREALATRLATIAMERSDSDLARSVLETSRAVVGMGEAGTSLAQLATSGGRAPRVIQARVGWVLQTGERLMTSRSSQAVTGALEVFRPGRSMDHVPGLSEVEAPVLITRNLDPEETLKDALDDLAYQGASVLVGGYDPEGASELAAYGESESIPVLLLVAPATLPKGARYTFVVGTPEPRWTTPVTGQAAKQVDPDRAVRIGMGEPPEHPLAFSCKQPPARIEEPTFPIADWRKAGIEAVAVDGPAWCARPLLHDLQSAKFTPAVFLGLEARDAAQPFDGTLHVASCGYLDEATEREPATLRAFRSASGRAPTWFQALGRDAALIAHNAVAPLPRDTFTRLQEVLQRRAETQERLAQGQASLWTTTAQGFAGARVLSREVRFISR